MASTLLLLVLFCAVFSAMNAASTTCPPNYVKKLGQCIPRMTRLLPLRSLSVWTGGKKIASPHVLLDKRPDTSLALTPKQQTVARVSTGKRYYLVFWIELCYRNPTDMNVPVSVYNQNNDTRFAQGLLNRKTRNGCLQLRLKTPSTGRIPTGNSFQIVVGEASNKVTINELALFGGSTPSAANHRTVVWALAVVVDFSNSKLEQYQDDVTAFNNVQDIRQQLNQMESHWEWMSRGKNIMEWCIIRIQMDHILEFNSTWWEFRDAIAQKVEDAVDIAKFDSNNDGIIDQVWGILATKEHQDDGADWNWMSGGRSTHLNTDMFIDGQGAYAVQVRCTGCFNHEVGHGVNIGLPDIYGRYGNLGKLTFMDDSWNNMPGTLIAWEMTKLNWLTPTKVHETTRGLRLKPLEEGGGAVLVQKKQDDTSGEYFMVEYRKTPTKGFGSALGDYTYDGLLITHINENAKNDNKEKPPLVRMEAADLNPQYETFPEENDLWYPGNPIMQPAFEAKSYNKNESSIVIFRIENFIRSGDYIGFDVSFDDR